MMATEAAVKVTVDCLMCGAPMMAGRTVARVVHHYDPPQVTDMIRFVCHTADCGNEVTVEGS